MSQEPPDTKAVDEPDDDASLFIVDPDDYEKTRKLRTIYNARDEVMKVRRKKRDNIDQYMEFNGPWYESYHTHLTETVASYGNEVMPLILEAKEKGVIDDDDLQVNDIDILDYIYCEGRIQDDDEFSVPPPGTTMAVYRQIDRIMRKLGMGLELQEDKGPAEI